MILPTSKARQKVNGMITLNNTAMFLWDCEGKGIDIDRQESIAKMPEEFKVDEVATVLDVNGFSDMLLQRGLAVEEDA